MRLYNKRRYFSSVFWEIFHHLLQDPSREHINLQIIQFLVLRQDQKTVDKPRIFFKTGGIGKAGFDIAERIAGSSTLAALKI